MDKELQKLKPEDFPPLLREIPDAPASLYLRGKLPDFTAVKWLTVVGTRNYTPYGKQACEHLIQGLAGYPVAIVSGLALGIDAIAHRSALNARLATVAIPGSGLGWDVMYPRTNYSLAREIIEKGGAHLSEFEPGWKPRRESFLQRNRIMAGISHATLIIEANKRSGTMVTARIASDYSRDVLVVPGPIFNEGSSGTHYYLTQGATPIGSPEDILGALGIEARTEVAARPDLSIEEAAVLDALTSPLPRDALIRTLDMPASAVASLLSIMELKGYIAEEMGAVRALV